MKRYLLYTSGLIALYLVVSKSGNAGNVIGASAQGATSFITVLQGR